MQTKPNNRLAQCLPITFNSKIKLSWLSRLKFNLKARMQENGRILFRDLKDPAKVFLVGSGNRIHQNFLPALHRINQPIEITGIYSRTFQHARELADGWGIDAQQKLESPALENADIIIISITAQSVPEVLKRIQNFTDTSNKILIVDTPVFAGLKTVFSSYILRRFANVIVTEDYMNFPQFKHIRDIIEKGGLGQIKTIQLNHIGYRYHGLALARSLLGFPLIKSVSYQGDEIHYDTGTGCEIIVNEPYQKLNGYLYVKGEKGTLLYCPKKYLDSMLLASEGAVDYLLTEQYENDVFTGFKLMTPTGSNHFSADLFNRIQSLVFFAKDDFNTFKTMGLIEVISSAFSYNINSRYGFVNGLYDNYVSNLAYGRRTFGLPVLKIPYYAVKVLSVLNALRGSGSLS